MRVPRQSDELIHDWHKSRHCHALPVRGRPAASSHERAGPFGWLKAGARGLEDDDSIDVSIGGPYIPRDN